MEMSNYCRLCLIAFETYIDIFSETGLSKNINTILTQHFWFEVNENDGYSKNICNECWSKVEDFHLYYNQVYNAHNEFYSKYDNDLKIEAHEGSNPVTEDKLIKSEHVTEETVVIPDFAEDITTEALTENLEPSKSEYDSYVEDDEHGCNYSSEESIKELLANEDELKKPPTKRTTKKKNKPKTPASIRKPKTEEELKQRLKEDEQIREYFKMECELCSTKFKVFQNIKTHYRVAHKLNGYLSCCDKKFFKRWHALEHIERHLNPEAFKCHLCNKIYIDKRGLQTHMYSHLPVEEKPFICEKCPKSFAKNSLLRQHQIRHISDEEKSFFCEECGKAFATNCMLQFHIRAVHEGAFTHVCEICARSFKSKLFYESHMRLVHNNTNSPKVQCQQCGAWLKHIYSLRSHMRRHDDASRSFICNICGKQAPNRGALHSHKKYSHIIEPIHRCMICHKAFKKSVALKEHMTMHTGEVLYTCPHCPKTFNSSANLHSHRKKMHKKEWDENRRTKVINYNKEK